MGEVLRAARSVKRFHGHGGLMGLAGFVAGLGFLVYAPSLKAVANSLFLFAGFHLVGAVVLLASAYSLGLRRLSAGLRGRLPGRAASGFDFGWGPEWMNGLALVALAFVWGAVAVQVAAPSCRRLIASRSL